jgi:hypothetical protein
MCFLPITHEGYLEEAATDFKAALEREGEDWDTVDECGTVAAVLLCFDVDNVDYGLPVSTLSTA